LHCFAFGLQLPEHEPPLHTFLQTVPSCHAPAALQVSGVRPLHCFVPAAHSPVQAPAAQTWPVQGEAVPH
jgi:hypothetical protein